MNLSIIDILLSFYLILARILYYIFIDKNVFQKSVTPHTFSEFKNVGIFAGITIFVSICNLFALNVFAIFIRFSSVLKNPFRFSKIVTINDIATAITIIAGVPAPYPYYYYWSVVQPLADYLILLNMVLLLLLKILTTIILLL